MRESPEIHLHKHVQLTFEKGAKVIYWWNKAFSTDDTERTVARDTEELNNLEKEEQIRKTHTFKTYYEAK